ncbi:hypothetical protein MBLNU230_g2734t1 [Neophaeotheca triangularis]
MANPTHTLLSTTDPRKTTEPYTLTPHPTTHRLIDSHPGTRTVPMRVLCLGLSRTGTMTLFTALQQLGYKPYHMAVAISSPKTNFEAWSEALRAKYHNDNSGSALMKPWGREEFDKLLGNYDAVADVPCCMFVEELVAAYPDALVVLQTREVARWDGAVVGPWWRFARLMMPPAFGVNMPIAQGEFEESEAVGRAFEAHYEHVRRVVPKERLLEFRVQDGWAPLCGFLKVEKPQGEGEALPMVNDSKQFVDFHGILWWVGFGKMVGKMAVMGAVPVGVGLAALVWQRFGSLQGAFEAGGAWWSG